MRFNLYQTFAMAAVLAYGSLAVSTNDDIDEELIGLPQIFDERDDFGFAESYNFDGDEEYDDTLAEVDGEADCPCKDGEHKHHHHAATLASASASPCGGGCKPPSEYEEGVKAKVQSALWDTHANSKLQGKSMGCLQSYNQGIPAPKSGGGCGGGCGGGAPPQGGCSGGCGGGAQMGGQCGQLCDKAKEIIERAKAKKCCKASAKDRTIEELRRKIEDKNKDMIKTKDDAAQMISEMRKDCSQRYQKDQFSTLSKDFSDLKNTMERLLKDKKREDAENQKLRSELADAKCDAKTLKVKMESDGSRRSRRRGSGSGGDGEGSGGDGEGYDDEAEDFGDGCPTSTNILRMRARNALGKLHAREQEHCSQCANRLTCCGSGPACPCGTQSGPGCPQKLTMRPDCKVSPCHENCNASPCGSPCGAKPCGSPCATPCGSGCSSGAKTVQLRLSGGQQPMQKHTINLASGQEVKKDAPAQAAK